jgi:hypothetical protein
VRRKGHDGAVRSGVPAQTSERQDTLRALSTRAAGVESGPILSGHGALPFKRLDRGPADHPRRDPDRAAQPEKVAQLEDNQSVPDTFSIPGVTAAQLALLETKLRANGELVTMNSPTQCTIQGHHVIATAVYDPASALTVTIVSKPFYISVATIQEGLEKALQSG